MASHLEWRLKLTSTEVTHNIFEEKKRYPKIDPLNFDFYHEQLISIEVSKIYQADSTFGIEMWI